MKQLPNKSFVLDKVDGDALSNARTRGNIISYVDARMGISWVDEMDKHYTKKIAKIASVTGKWISDDDVGYLKMFDQFNVYNGYDYLRFETEDDLSKISLIFTAAAVVPDADDSSQMKIEAYVENQQEPPEEFEDEEYGDPMADSGLIFEVPGVRGKGRPRFTRMGIAIQIRKLLNMKILLKTAT